MSCTLGPLVEEANNAAEAAYEICEVDPSGLTLTPEELEIVEEDSWCQWQPTYTVPDIGGYLPTLVTHVKDKVYEELWAELQAKITALEANAAMVYSTKLERVTGDEAMAGQLEASYAQWESGSSALASSVQTALASQNYALSQQILETEASLDGKITANSEFYQTSLASVGETMAASGVLNSVTLADGSKVVSGFRSQASSTIGSEFTVFADTFKILNRVPNGSGGYDYSSVVAPFTVQNDTVYIGKVNTSEPQITYLGEFASAPSTAGLDKNVVYKNTTDGNTYLYNGTEWTIWILAAEGQGVVSAFIFTRSAKQPDAPSGGSWTSMLPTSLNVTFGGSSADADGATGIVWSDGVPADNGKPLWTATKWFTSDNQPPYEGPMWNTPTVLADTPKQNFQWNTSLAFPGDPGPTGTSNGWTDSAIGAVWIASSTTFNHATQSWSNWSIAKVKGEDGVDGIDVNIVFKVSSSNTVAPTITGTGALPAGWSDGIGQTYSTTSSSTPYLWYAKGTGIAGIWTWGVPTLNTATNVAELKLYKLNDTTMSTAGSYNFSTATLSGYETGWTTSVPALVNNGDKVYTTTAVVTGAKDSVVTPSWSTPVVYAQRTDGATGATGATGTRGSLHITVIGTYSSGSATSSAFQSATGLTDKVIGDWVTFNSSGGATDYYRSSSGSDSWVNAALYVNGNLIATGTISSSKLSADAIIGKTIAISSATSATAGTTPLGHSSLALFDTSRDKNAIGAINRSSGGYGISGIGTNTTSSVGVHGSGNWGVLGEAIGGGFGFYTTHNCYFEGANYPFTGSHIGYTPNAIQLETGDIVTVVDGYNIEVNNSVFNVLPSTAPYDKKVIGVYNGLTDSIEKFAKNSRALSENESFAPFIESLKSTHYVVGINSLGEGGINVCNQNGDIEVGDYICTSSIQGKGMKQDDDLLHSYTVAKALEVVVWDNEVAGSNGCFEFGGHKCKMIACTYHCG